MNSTMIPISKEFLEFIDREYGSDVVSQIQAYGIEDKRIRDEHNAFEAGRKVGEQIINLDEGEEMAKRKVPELSKSENVIFRKIIDGKRNSEIAKELFRSSRTIETHRSRMLNKLSLKNNVELVKWAIKNRYLTIKVNK